MPLVEKRYAEALIKVGLNKKLLDVFQEELNQVDDLIQENIELRRFLNNPRLKVNDKKTVIEKLLNKKADKNIINFLNLLIDKNRIKNISQIRSQYNLLADEIRQCLKIKVISAAEVSQDQLDKIGEKYKKQYGSKAVKIEQVIDPAIIGGIIVKIGDRMIDGSIKGKFEGMLSAIG